MQELIGKVVLDYQYYSGSDLYSDGAIEDELLEIAKNHEEHQLNQVIAERNSWPVLYHFSHIRQNILEWLPITKNDTVLEIGSGCGAITGVLARKSKYVHCIELSKKRSYINAYRNREHDNIRIDVGNFQDIEQNITEKYDYITLIGVFEYAQGYIGGEKPYVSMLSRIAKHLKPQGKIVIAIENRLGLKYWAGCTEDHVGQYFKGLEGYSGSEGVRTFSKNEITHMIQLAGDFSYEFYYPYPDYKLPLSIYSDRRQPFKGELSNNICNFDRERMVLFDEAKVYDTLLEDDIYREFSNSYLVLISHNGAEKEDTGILYTKYSNERSREFAIKTELIKKCGKLYVQKTACYEEGKDHIVSMFDKKKKLEKQYADTFIKINECQLTDAGVEFTYVNGITLEEQMDQLAVNRRFDEAKNLLLQYLNMVRDAGEKQLFVPTDAFAGVFGHPSLPEGLSALQTTDIDMVLSNILIDDGWNLIDYEWTFDFPIPLSYVLYRIIHYYVEARGRRDWINAAEWYERMGISEEEVVQYAEMERNFQRYIQGNHIPVRELYGNISPGYLNIQMLLGNLREEKKSEELQVFYAEADGFSEEKCFRFSMKGGIFQGIIPIPRNARKLRIDPGAQYGKLTVKELSFTDEQAGEIKFVTNGYKIKEDQYLFCTTDPMMIIDQIPETAKKIKIDVLMETSETALTEGLFISYQMLSEKEQENCRLRQKLAQLEGRISDMENTKVWKAYRQIKGFTRKD